MLLASAVSVPGMYGREIPTHHGAGRHIAGCIYPPWYRGGIPGGVYTHHTHREAYQEGYIPTIHTQGGIPGGIPPTNGYTGRHITRERDLCAEVPVLLREERRNLCAEPPLSLRN